MATILVKAEAYRSSCVQSHSTSANVHLHSETIMGQAPDEVMDLRWTWKFLELSPNNSVLFWFSSINVALTLLLCFQSVLLIIKHMVGALHRKQAL